MDIVSVAMLSIFGAAAVGGIAGVVVGRCTQFEIGLMVGLAIFGGVTLYHAGRCFLDYREFTQAGTNAVWGEVIEIIAKPSNESGSITSPAPIVRFTTADGVVLTVEGATAGSAKVGQHVTVLVDRTNPANSRVGQIDQLRGGAIAFMLFGTFPMSFAVVLLAGLVDARRVARANGPPTHRKSRRTNARAVSAAAEAIAARTLAPKPEFTRSTMLFVAAMTASILWIALPGADLVLRFSQGFGAIAASIVTYAIAGGGFGTSWVVGLSMLALNFGVWSFALYLLR